MKVAMSAGGSNRQKAGKMKMYLNKISMDKVNYFSPFKLFNYKDELIGKFVINSSSSVEKTALT
jgi:hypothetical protein